MLRIISGWVAFALIVATYVYMVVAAVGNLVMLPEMAASLELQVNVTGWFWLWFGVLLPVVGFFVALFIARGRKGGTKLFVLLAALAVVAAVQLETSLLVPAISFLV